MTFAGQLKECFRKICVIHSYEVIFINNTVKTYQVSDYVIDLRQRTVTQKDMPINLNKKSFDLLAVLLKKHGKLITKDELLATVWPNQFITDSALNKQIARLRNVFDPKDSSDSIIETVRGVGIRFVADVKINQSNQVIEKPKSNFLKNFVFAVIFMSIGIFIFSYFIQMQPVEILPKDLVGIEPFTPNIDPITVAIVPAKKTDAWLDIGGLSYLSDLLQDHKEIDTISPQTQWFNNEETHVLALQLSQSNNIDYALVIKSIKLQQQYIANIILRNKHGVLANGEIQAKSISNLYEKIDNWAIQQLNISSGVIFKEETQISQISDFALESYLRGLSAARNQNFTQASQFLQTAINQDTYFFQAWLLQAKMQTELGNFQTSLAMTNTIENLPSFNPKLLNDLYNVKAKAYIYLNNIEQAEIYLNKSIQLSEQTNDMKVLIESLGNLAMINERIGKIFGSTLQIREKQLALIKKYNPLPTLIAESNFNLAVANQHIHNYDKAFKYINKAISQFDKLNNKSGLFTSYRVSANIHSDLAETGLALLELKKAEQWINDIDSPIILANFYLAHARNLYEEGYHKLANIEIEKLRKLSVTYNNSEPKVMALIAQAELEISYQFFDKADKTIGQLLEIIKVNINQYSTYSSYVAALDMYVTARFEPAKIAKEKTNKYLETYPSLKDSIEKSLRRVEAHILISEGFNSQAIQVMDKLMEDYMSEKLYLWAIYIGYELLDIQWLSDDKRQYIKTVNRIQEIAKFDYPILKFRSRYLAYNKDFINAAILMRELKPKARDFWTIEDQLLLEGYQSQASKFTGSN